MALSMSTCTQLHPTMPLDNEAPLPLLHCPPMKRPVPFGHEFRKAYYTLLDDRVNQVNHGLFGLTPDPVYDAYIRKMKEDISFPDRYCRLLHRQEYVKSLQLVAKLVKCDYRWLALVNNTTTGINTVLRSYKFSPGDKVVIALTSYGACAKTVAYLKHHMDVETVVVELNYPISDDDIVAQFDEAFRGHRPKLAMFDTVLLMPGVAVPYQRLVELCRQYHVLSLVDGAHSVGLIPLDLSATRPDFFVSSCHKWLGTPRGCALLYVDRSHWHHIETMPISHSYVEPSQATDDDNWLVDHFYYCGTTNYAPLTVVPQAIAFREHVGGEEAIYQYCSRLATMVGERIAAKWGTQVLPSNPPMAMVTVEVPIDKLGCLYQQFADNMVAWGDRSGELMMERHQFVPWIAHNGRVWARFSCQVYNEASDFDWASDELMAALATTVAEAC